jgi:hypothetical protein
MTLFNRIEKEKMKNKEIYTEYCKINNLKKNIAIMVGILILSFYTILQLKKRKNY